MSRFGLTCLAVNFISVTRDVLAGTFARQIFDLCAGSSMFTPAAVRTTIRFPRYAGCRTNKRDIDTRDVCTYLHTRALLRTNERTPETSRSDLVFTDSASRRHSSAKRIHIHAYIYRLYVRIIMCRRMHRKAIEKLR